MMIYLDYAATTPMSEEALQTYMKAASQYFGNEQSLHDIEERLLLYYKFAENICGNDWRKRTRSIFHKWWIGIELSCDPITSKCPK